VCIIHIRNITILKKENIGLIEVMGLAVLPARIANGNGGAGT